MTHHSFETGPGGLSIHDRLARLTRKGQDFLGVPYPILGGAMSWVSNHALVAAISNGGGFGVLAAGAMEPHHLDGEIQATKALTGAPFGVNVISLHPKLLDLIGVCRDHQISHVAIAGGIPPQKAIDAIKDFGAKVMCFTPTAALGRRLVRQGVDALIIEGHEAGGHIGPVSTTVLAQEILPVLRDVVPVFVAGGIGCGEMILSYLEMGAAGCQLGTRFVCAAESPAHDAFKNAFIRAAAREAVVTPQLDPRFPVIPVRALLNEGSKTFIDFQRQTIDRYHRGEISLADGQMAIEHFWAGSLRRAVIDGDVTHGSMMAGQSVGFVDRIESAADILRTLMADGAAALERRCAL